MLLLTNHNLMKINKCKLKKLKIMKFKENLKIKE